MQSDVSSVSDEVNQMILWLVCEVQKMLLLTYMLSGL